MKKFLSLLVGVLFTLTSFGQDPSEINYGAVNTVTKVGDELTVEFKYTKKDGGHQLYFNLILNGTINFKLPISNLENSKYCI